MMTHTSDPVPFIIYRGGEGQGNGASSYDETQAASTGLVLEGHNLMKELLGWSRSGHNIKKGTL